MDMNLTKRYSVSKLCASAISLSVTAFLFCVFVEGMAQKRAASSATGAVKITTSHPGSVVFINNVRHGVTNDAGELNLPRVKAGAYPVRVRTVGFVDWQGRIVIAAGKTSALNVTQKPESDEAILHYQRGDALRDKGQNKDALEEYRQALAIRSAFPVVRLAMTRSLTTIQDFEEAEKQIKAAMKEMPRPSPEAHTILANLRRSQGLYDEAIAEYKKALQLARNDSFEANIGIGIAYKEAGEVDLAVRHYRAGLIQDMDTEPILYYQLAEILEGEKRNKEAIEAYRNYIRLDPEGELASAAESIIQILQQEIDER